MSVKRIIQESLDKNPLGVKEALEEALQDRVRAALEEKYAEMTESKDEDDEDEDDDDDDEDDEDEMDESFDLSDYAVEELEDFMESAEFDQLDEISKQKVQAYMDKSHDEYKRLQQKGGAKGGTSVMNKKQKRRYATGSDASDNAFKKLTGRARVNAT